MSRPRHLPGHDPASMLAKGKHAYEKAAIAYVDAMLDGADEAALKAAREMCSQTRLAYKNASENYRRSLSGGRW